MNMKFVCSPTVVHSIRCYGIQRKTFFVQCTTYVNWEKLDLFPFCLQFSNVHAYDIKFVNGFVDSTDWWWMLWIVSLSFTCLLVTSDHNRRIIPCIWPEISYVSNVLNGIGAPNARYLRRSQCNQFQKSSYIVENRYNLVMNDINRTNMDRLLIFVFILCVKTNLNVDSNIYDVIVSLLINLIGKLMIPRKCMGSP